MLDKKHINPFDESNRLCKDIPKKIQAVVGNIAIKIIFQMKLRI